MTKRTKRDLLLILFGVCLFTALNNLGSVFGFFNKLVALCLPVVLGFTLAFILNVPVRGFEKLLDRIAGRFKKKLSHRLRNSLSIALSVISILLVLVIVFAIAIPRVSESVMSFISAVDAKIPSFLIFLEENGIDTTFITKQLANFNLEDLIKQVTQGAFNVVTSAVDATVIAVKYLGNIVFAIVIALYLLLDKDNLSRQAKKFLYSFLPDEKADKIYRTSYLIRDTFANFLSGQCLEAVILGVLMLIMFTLFKLPYASLIALLAAVFSFVPYIGAVVACAVGALLTLIVSPQKALVCVIVYLGTQFFEQHFIYPHVVGNSVGLSPFYTIVAVLLGGNLFGVFGMLFFIPLFSVILTLLGDYTNELNRKKAENNSLKTEKHNN